MSEPDLGRTTAMPLLCCDDATLDAVVGPPAYRTRQVRRWLYRAGVDNVDAMSDLPADLRTRLAAHGVGSLTERIRSVGDDGMTVKWLWDTDPRCGAQAQVETVLMRYARRATVCVSSQAGCAMACPFCATGQGGFVRHLRSGEIVEQVLAAGRHVRDLAANGDDRSPDHVTNVVFMGMGEPLANYDAVVEAVRRCTHDIGLSSRSITVSTIGIPDRIRSMATDMPPGVTLALSLHAPDDALRDRLVPVNARWPIDAVLDAVRDYRRHGGRRVTIEYTLMDGVNDSPAQAEQLASRIGKLRAHVNCIPMNPTGDPAYRPSKPEAVRAFASTLSSRGVNATVRRNRGTDMDAACGQLRARDAGGDSAADIVGTIGD